MSQRPSFFFFFYLVGRLCEGRGLAYAYTVDKSGVLLANLYYNLYMILLQNYPEVLSSQLQNCSQPMEQNLAPLSLFLATLYIYYAFFSLHVRLTKVSPVMAGGWVMPSGFCWQSACIHSNRAPQLPLQSNRHQSTLPQYTPDD